LTSVLSSNHEYIEKTFIMPSELSRNLLKIKHGDGYCYFDEIGSPIVRYGEIGSSFENQQEVLLVQSKPFEKSIGESKYIPFWLCRVYRDSTPKAKEMFGSSLRLNFDKTFVIINKDGRLKEVELIEPINIDDSNKTTTKNKMILDLLYGDYSQIKEDDQ